MDFHALMKKKLGGKYDQPKFTDDNRAREDTVADDKAIEAAEVRDIEEEGELTPPPKRPQLDITLTAPLEESTPAKQDKKGKKKASFRPRVQCSNCDFVGIEGREMDNWTCTKPRSTRKRKNVTTVTFCTLATQVNSG